jgi:hypothetical protein
MRAPLFDKAFLTRLRDLELSILGEFAVGLVVAFIFTTIFFSTHLKLYFAAMSVVIAAIAYSAYKHWKMRALNRQYLLAWSEEPIRWAGSLVIQDNQRGERIGTIDPSGHYSVRWERFDANRALYLIKQGNEIIRISTLAPNAAEILQGALHVANYPCEEWPNLDL